MSAPHVVVVGAGIAGLTTAYRLSRLRPDVRITVLDAAPAAGGKIRTGPIAGITVDEAADAFLARVPITLQLVHELGLEAFLTTPAERRAFVYRHGRLQRFPEGLVLGVPTDLDALRASGLVSDAAVDRRAQRLFPDHPGIVAAYRAERPDATPDQLWCALATDASSALIVPSVSLTSDCWVSSS